MRRPGLGAREAYARLRVRTVTWIDGEALAEVPSPCGSCAGCSLRLPERTVASLRPYFGITHELDRAVQRWTR